MIVYVYVHIFRVWDIYVHTFSHIWNVSFSYMSYMSTYMRYMYKLVSLIYFLTYMFTYVWKYTYMLTYMNFLYVTYMSVPYGSLTQYRTRMLKFYVTHDQGRSHKLHVGPGGRGLLLLLYVYRFLPFTPPPPQTYTTSLPTSVGRVPLST